MISFYSADRPIPIRNRRVVRSWLKEVASDNKYSIASLSYVFCSDAYLLDMNRSFLDHDYYTDIITFPMIDSVEEVNAECYISVDRVKDNAKKIDVTFVEELNRVVVHGLLHLLGFGDKSAAEAEQMRILENDALMRFVFHVEQFELTKDKKRGVPRGTLE